MAARVRYVDVGEDTPALHVFESMANAPEVLAGFRSLGGRLLLRTALDPRIRELVICAIAVDTECDYEWSHHTEIARGVGVTEEELRALAEHRPDALGDAERACVSYALRVERSDVAAGDLERLRSAGLDDARIVELTMVAAFYGMTARYLQALGVELDEGREGFRAWRG